MLTAFVTGFIAGGIGGIVGAIIYDRVANGNWFWQAFK